MRTIVFTIIALVLFISCSTENNSVYELTTSVVPTGSGTITPEQGSFDEGTTVEVEAAPNEGWVFSRFEGDYSSSTNPTSFLMNNDKQITALFEKRNYPLSITVTGKGSVHEEVVQPKSTDYPHGTLVELSVSAEEGYSFSGWGGDLTGFETPQRLIIDSEKNVSADFQTIVRNFGGSGSDHGWVVESTSDNGTVVAGTTTSVDWDFDSSGLEGVSVFVLKLDQYGKKEWVRAFGGSGYDFVHALISSDDGGYVIAGNTQSNDGNFKSFNNGASNAFAVKLDSLGNVVWVNIFGGSAADASTDIIATRDGGFAISGVFASNDGVFIDKNRGGRDIFISKFDSQGGQEWLQVLGGSGDDSAWAITELRNGSLALGGITNSNDGDFSHIRNGPFNGFIATLNSEGNIEWIKNFGSSGEPEGIYTIDSASDGGVVLTAAVFIDTYNGQEIIGRVRKLTSTGETEWVLDPDNDFSAYMSIKELSDNNYILGVNQNNREMYGMTFYKIGQDGNQIWSKNYGGSGHSFFGSLVSIENAGFVATGYTNSSDGIFQYRESDSQDVWVVRMNSDGEIISFIGQ